MLCKIADLYAEIPEAGGMSPRCRDYLVNEDVSPDIIIKEEYYDIKGWPGLNPDLLAYMDSGQIFYTYLLKYGGMMLHASALELDGGAYLFSGPSGMGKSTHTGLWQKEFPSARLFNDDKPALRRIDGVWYAYGTPWSGKHGININIKVPLRGICFLRQGDENKIRRLSNIEAVSAVMSQTIRGFRTERGLDKLINTLGQLVEEIPIYELTNRPEPAAAHLSHATMTGDKVISDEN
jgi:hypothetical protein